MWCTPPASDIYFCCFICPGLSWLEAPPLQLSLLFRCYLYCCLADAIDKRKWLDAQLHLVPA